MTAAQTATAKAKPKKAATHTRQKPYELVNAGHVRATVSNKVRLAHWNENLATNPHTSPVKILTDQRYVLEHFDGGLYAKGFACPQCSNVYLTKKGTPAVRLVAGSYGAGCGPEQSTRAVCQSCGWTATSAGLVPTLFDSPRAQFAYLEQHCRGAAPQFQRWTAARYGGKLAIRKATHDATAAALPDEHNGACDCCLVEALDEPMATTLARELDDDAFVSVPVTGEGEPRVLNWHGARPTVNEMGHYNEVKSREDAQTRKRIEREVRDFRAQRLHEAGFRMG